MTSSILENFDNQEYRVFLDTLKVRVTAFMPTPSQTFFNIITTREIGVCKQCNKEP